MKVQGTDLSGRLSGIMEEILWSDPRVQPGRETNNRGLGIFFGPDVTQRFLKENKLGKRVLNIVLKFQMVWFYRSESLWYSRQ